MATSGIKLLFDENVSHRHVTFVAQESRLAHIQHVFAMGWAGAEDSVWIPRAVQSGFCIVTGDRNERTRGFTAADLKTLGARVLLLGPFFDGLTRWERAQWLVAHVEALRDLASGLAPGSVILVNRRGTGKAVN